MFHNKKIENNFILSKIENMMFSNNILVIFTCFLRIIFKNNYTNIKNLLK